jgi:polysaccharide biosynthesis/export protein
MFSKEKFVNVSGLSSIRILAISATLCISAWAQDYSASNKLDVNPAAVAKEQAQEEPKQVQEAPTPAPEYVVGEGDLLRINVWKEPEISQSVTVRPDGNISLPLINEFRAAGLSPREIQELVTDKLKSVLTNPQVTVTVAEVRSKMVYVTGEVGKPGAYSIVAPMNVLQLIARAGGLTQFANRKEIYVLRPGSQENTASKETRLKFNYKEVVKGHNSEQNVVLQSGDTVVVP